MKKHLVLICLSLTAFSSIAQNIRVKGIVTEKQGEKSLPMPGVSLSLLDTDSTLITGTTSDGKGVFSLTVNHLGDYLLRLSFIGYQTEEILLKNLTKALDLGAVELTESAVELDEVTVSASNITYKVDRMIVLPTEAALKNAYDTYDLMNNLVIPRLRVNPVMKTVETFGTGGVQLRINGIMASQSEVTALLAKDILRIEVIEQPGERYGDNSLGAVVNLIVKKREDGGQVSLQGMTSPVNLFTEDYASVKYNHGKSQWGVTYSLEAKELTARKDVTETYHIDDQIIERIKEGIPEKQKFSNNRIDLSYNLSDVDKYTFNVVFRNHLNDVPLGNQSNKLHEKGTPEFIFAKTLESRYSYSPALDIYFRKFLPDDRSIQFNAVGTLINSDNHRNYREYTDAGEELAQIIMDVDGKKQSVIGEVIYDKSMEKIKLSAGVRHFQMYSENRYRGTNPVTSDMNQMQSSAFFEFQGKIRKLDYLGSLGMTRSYFKEGDISHSYYTFTPTLRLSFVPHPNGHIAYRFNTTPTIPSLGLLTNVEQDLDTIQTVRGNPDLLSYNTYYNTLNYSGSYKKFTGSVRVNYAWHENRIMESVFVENGRLIIMDENQKSFKEIELGGEIYLRNLDFLGLKNFMTLSFSGGIDKYRSNGNRYTHSYHDFFYDARMMLNYSKFGFMAQYAKNKYILVGETIYKGENMTAFMGTYTHRQFQAGAGIFFPFTNDYRTGTDRVSSVAPVTSWTYAKEAGQMVFIQLAYHFEFGKRYKSGEKKLNNSDKDSGILNTNR